MRRSRHLGFQVSWNSQSHKADYLNSIRSLLSSSRSGQVLQAQHSGNPQCLHRLELKWNHNAILFVFVSSPSTNAWHGGCLLTKDSHYPSKMAVSRREYEEHGFTLCQERFDVWCWHFFPQIKNRENKQKLPTKVGNNRQFSMYNWCL